MGRSLIRYQAKLDTENGPSYGDEIHLGESGFNNDGLRLEGWWPVEDVQPLSFERGYFEGTMVTLLDNLETFTDKGRYSGPQFTGGTSVGVTALEFLKNDI